MIGTPRMFSPTVNVLVSFVDEIVARHEVPRVYDSNGYGVGIAALGRPTVFRQLDQWLRCDRRRLRKNRNLGSAV